MKRFSILPMIAAVLWAWPATANDPNDVDLKIILAVDVSSSVDMQEAILQRDGYVHAFLNPVLVDRMLSGPLGRIAVSYVEWAGVDHIRVVADWRLLASPADATTFSRYLAGQRISTAPFTSISGIIDFARGYMRRTSYRSEREVIDISGDGPNSDGRRVRRARDDAVRDGITINGLPVLSTRHHADSKAAPFVGLYGYYVANVIGGPGAFAVEAVEFESFAEALLSKLSREMEWRKGEDKVALAPAPTER